MSQQAHFAQAIAEQRRAELVLDARDRLVRLPARQPAGWLSRRRATT